MRRGLGAGRRGDGDVLDQVGEPGLPLGVVIAADLVEHQQGDVSRTLDGADHHRQAIVELETTRCLHGRRSRALSRAMPMPAGPGFRDGAIQARARRMNG